ncbi:MAG: AAA family ATPase [Phycisphaerae bacterium]|nr:AAA family ATPase [Phycisphaerae bacterium]
MGRSIRAILFNMDEEQTSSLRAILLSIDGLHIVAEVDDSAMLAPAMSQFACDLLVVHLDPSPESVILFAGQVLSERPDVAALAISECSEGSVILAALRAGLREYLTKPVQREELEAAIARSVQQTAGRIEPGHVIAVMSSVGGAGGTTVAVNLAVELAAMQAATDRPVALVDLDYRFGQVATMLDIQAQYGIADLCDTPEQLDPQLINKAMVKHATGVHVLAKPSQLAQTELITAAHCASVLTSLQDLYAYVVVDGPTRFDVGAKSVLDLAEFQIMVMQLLVPSVRNVQRILEELGANGFNLDRVHLVCNRFTKELGCLEKEHVESTLNREIYAALPDDWRTVSTAVNMGMPLAQSVPKSKIRQAYTEMAALIHAALGGNDEDAGGHEQIASRKGAGLFSKIFS